MKIVVCEGRFEVFSDGEISPEQEKVLLAQLADWVDWVNGMPSDGELMAALGIDDERCSR